MQFLQFLGKFHY